VQGLQEQHESQHDQDIGRKLAISKDTVEILTLEVMRLKSELIAHSSLIKKYESRITQQNSNLQKLKENNVYLTNKLEDERARINRFKETVEKKNTIINELTTKISKLNAIKNQLKEDKARLSGKLSKQQKYVLVITKKSGITRRIGYVIAKKGVKGLIASAFKKIKSALSPQKKNSTDRGTVNL